MTSSRSRFFSIRNAIAEMVASSNIPEPTVVLLPLLLLVTMIEDDCAFDTILFSSAMSASRVVGLELSSAAINPFNAAATLFSVAEDSGWPRVSKLKLTCPDLVDGKSNSHSSAELYRARRARTDRSSNLTQIKNN